MAMLENHLLGYLAVKEHQERLLAEARKIHLARRAARGKHRLVGHAASRIGVRLEAFGRRLQALDSAPAGRH